MNIRKLKKRNADGLRSIPYLWQRCVRHWKKAAIKGRR